MLYTLSIQNTISLERNSAPSYLLVELLMRYNLEKKPKHMTLKNIHPSCLLLLTLEGE